jgi:hypothetical protein
LRAVENIKLLTKDDKGLAMENILELIKSFSYNWFSLDSYDKDKFPNSSFLQYELFKG